MKRTFLLASVLLAVLAFSNNAAQAQQKKENGQTEIRGSLSVTTDTWDGSDETRINYVEDGHRYKIRLKGAKILEMYLDENKVAEADFPKYDPLVKKILVQIEKDREQAQKDRAQAERDREQAQRDRTQAEKDRQQAERDREQSAKDRTRAEGDRAQAEQDRRQAEKDRAQAGRDREQAVKDRAQAEKDREQAQKDRAQAEEDRKLMNAMIDELIKEKLINSRDDLTSLELDDTSLTVNGKKQAESLHGRFKEKYLKGKHNRLVYRNSGDTRQFSLD